MFRLMSAILQPITNIQVHGDYITFDFMGGGAKSNFLVFLPAYYGCKVTVQPGSTSPVNAGGNFSFKVELLPSHNISTIKVTANDVELTPSGNVYTISNIQADQIVRIEGVKFNTFPITVTAGANGSITPAGDAGVVYVNHGGIQKFNIKPDNGYSIEEVIVDGANLGAITSHTFKNVLGAHTISATFKRGGQYTINTSIEEAHFETFTDRPSEKVEVIVSSDNIGGNISVAAPPKFQISNNGNSWYQSFSIAKTQLPYKIYIRFVSAEVGTFNEILTLKSVGAYAEIKLIGVATTVGVNDIENNQNITIYPNPTTGKLRMENGELKIEKVEIFDVYGKSHSLLITRHEPGETVIDIANLSSGIYMIAIHTDKGTIHKKVVKE